LEGILVFVRSDVTAVLRVVIASMMVVMTLLLERASVAGLATLSSLATTGARDEILERDVGPARTLEPMLRAKAEIVMNFIFTFWISETF
jgi:hypothetical protein